MQWFGAVILGFIQGLTEFLPISSSAHLRIAGEFLPAGADPGAAFTAITQLGTETAVLVYFWRDIVRIVKQWFLALAGKVSWKDPDAQLGCYVIIGSVPIVVCGVLFEDAIESVLRNLWIVASMLILFAVFLAVADSKGKQRKNLADMNLRDGLLYGAAQALALIPGVSRSGGTITAGLLLGYTREAAARYSFLLAIPAVFGSGLYKLYQVIKEPVQEAAYTMPQTLVAAIISFCVGYGIIAWFLKYVSHHSYRGFVWYRIALGTLVYLFLGLGALHP